MLLPEKVAERIEGICKERGLRVAHMLSSANLDKSVVDRMKGQRSMPSADKIAIIAQTLDVPSEYILGLGIFEDWNVIVENRASVLTLISGMLKTLSGSIKSGVSDSTLAWLIAMFNVKFEMNEYGRPEFGAMSPFATFDTDVSSLEDSTLSDETREAATEFEKLDTKGRRIVWGKIYEEQQRVSENKKETSTLSDAQESATAGV